MTDILGLGASVAIGIAALAATVGVINGNLGSAGTTAANAVSAANAELSNELGNPAP